jgi:hypothetical protein
MARPPLALIALMILVLVPAACMSNSVPLDLAFVNENSCGRSFTAVNDAGTAQLSLSPLRDDDLEDIAPGLVDLADETWTGVVEVGSGLGVWPCHDVASDFKEVVVVAVWVAASGTIEIPQLLPATGSTGGGGVRERLTIVVTDLVLTNEGETIAVPEVTLSTGSWGFYGG